MKPTQPYREFALVLLSATLCQGAVLDESIQDLSNNPSAPTSFSLSTGVNSLSGTVGVGDHQDWVTFAIPGGFQLSSITHVTYQSQDSTAFVGMQSGTSFVGQQDAPGSYLGYFHISSGTVNLNILPGMGSAFQAQGFTPPLQAGNYTFLVQQVGDAVTTYRLDYNLAAVPEPPAQAAIAGAAVCIFYFCKRRFQRS